MSKLKVYHCNEWHNEYTEFYMKDEADKVIAKKDAEIAELKQKLDKAIAERDGNQVCIDALKQKLINEVVNDFTEWNDCDANTENPGEKYYRCHYGWVLVKMQARCADKEYDIPVVAKFNKASHLWTFSIIAEREMVRDLKVVKWRPIH